MVWKPHVTVAAVISQNDQFLLVKEHTTDGIRFNQPAGHLEAGEDLISAIKREVLEETAWQFEPEYLVSVQLWRKSPQHASYLRFCFSGYVHSYNPAQPLDEGIIATHWHNHEQIIENQDSLRSPLVLMGIDDYLQGRRYSLTALQSFIDDVQE